MLRKAGRASKSVLLTVSTVSEQSQWQLWASYTSSFRKVMSDIRRVQEVSIVSAIPLSASHVRCLVLQKNGVRFSRGTCRVCHVSPSQFFLLFFFLLAMILPEDETWGGIWHALLDAAVAQSEPKNNSDQCRSSSACSV